MEEGVRSETMNFGDDVYIPEEIIANILSRLPSKTLLRMRYVCKSWYSLITNDGFQTLHLKHFNSKNNPDSPAWFSYNPYRTLYNPNNESDSLFFLHGRSFSTWYPLPFPDDEIFEGFKSAWIIGSCNGVVCLLLTFSYFKSYFKYHASKEPCIVLYNPSIRRHRSIKFLEATGPFDHSWGDEVMSNSSSEITYPYVLGFGFDERSNDYKIVMICGDGFLKKSVIVYSSKKGFWTEIGVEVPIFHHWHPCKGYHKSFWKTTLGIYHNGACYWVCIVEGKIKILCFLLDEEKFNYIPAPAEYIDSFFGMFVYEDKLALSVIRYSSHYHCWEVWLLMGEEEEEEEEDPTAWITWNLLFINETEMTPFRVKKEIEMIALPPTVLKSDSDDRVLLLRRHQNMVLLAYDPMEEEYGHVKLFDHTDQLIHYRESLVLL